MDKTVSFSWLRLTPEDLGYQLEPRLSEAELIYIQRVSDWPNVCGTNLKVEIFEEEGTMKVDFGSVSEINHFLYFHGSKKQIRMQERSLGSLKKLLIPNKSISRMLNLKVLSPEVKSGLFKKAAQEFKFEAHPFRFEDTRNNTVTPTKTTLLVQG